MSTGPGSRPATRAGATVGSRLELALPLFAAAGDAQVRQLAHEILSRPEYLRQRPPPVWIAAVLEAIAEVLRGFTRWMDGLWEQSPVVYVALVGGILVVAVVLLGHVIYAVRRALLAGAASAPAKPTSAGGVDLVAEAEALAREGFHLDAAHRMQLATIALLVERGIVALGRSDPNRALRSRLREAPLPADDRRDLLVALDQFERRWFRDRTGDVALYDRWRGLYDRLRVSRQAA